MLIDPVALLVIASARVMGLGEIPNGDQPVIPQSRPPSLLSPDQPLGTAPPMPGIIVFDLCIAALALDHGHQPAKALVKQRVMATTHRGKRIRLRMNGTGVNGMRLTNTFR